jgi:hypothetical protein
MQSEYGEQALAYFRGGFVEPETMNRSVIRYCGPLFEMIPALFYGDPGPGKYETRHLVLALLALLFVPGLFVCARFAGDWRVPVLAVIALALTPRFSGHLFNNSKDIPFAVALIWFIAAVVAAFAHGPPKWRHVISCGVTGGIALAARPGGLPILVALLLAPAVIAPRTRTGNASNRTAGQSIARTAVKGLAMLLIAWVIMAAPWPWAHANPIVHPVRAMQAAGRFPVEITMLYDGRLIESTDVPRMYLPKFLLITTPPALLALALVGLIIAVRAQLAARRTIRSFFLATTMLWFLLPVAAFLALRPHVYDGMRHFLFVLPPLAVLAAVGATGIVDLARGRPWRMVLWIVVAAGLLSPVVSIVRLHPYQSTYFNVLVGGVRGAQDRYETDYWVASYREAMQWINRQARQRPDEECRVLIGGNPSLREAASYYAAENVTTAFTATTTDAAELPAGVDFYVATTRFGAADVFPDSPIVHTVGRGGAVFTVIRAHRAP